MTDKERMRRIHDEAPQPPEGFASRHDALLFNLTEKEEKVMKRKIPFGFVVALIILLLAIGVAVATSLGVFGQFGNINEDPRLSTLEDVAETYTDENPVKAQDDKYPEVTFALTQGHYDGESLYVAYTLKGQLYTVDFLDPKDAEGVDWDMTPDPNYVVERSWLQMLTPEDRTAMQASLDNEGHVLMDVYQQYLGDGVTLEDGTYINPSMGDTQIMEDGSLMCYMEYEYPLPENAQNQDSLTLVYTIYRSSHLYYEDELGSYFKYDMDAEPESIKVPVTIHRNSENFTLSAQGSFADYQVSATATVSAVDIKIDSLVEGPQSWIEAWETWETGGDYLFEYALYADDTPCRPAGFSAGIEDGKLRFQQIFARPADYTTLTLRPIFNESGERAEDAITLE